MTEGVLTVAHRIIAVVDKTVVRVTGLEVRGMKPQDVEAHLSRALGRPARVIGVAGDSLEFDVYGLSPEAVLMDSHNVIRAIALADGVRATEVAQVDQAEKARTFSVEELAGRVQAGGCAGERVRL